MRSLRNCKLRSRKLPGSDGSDIICSVITRKGPQFYDRCIGRTSIKHVLHESLCMQRQVIFHSPNMACHNCHIFLVSNAFSFFCRSFHLRNMNRCDLLGALSITLSSYVPIAFLAHLARITIILLVL